MANRAIRENLLARVVSAYLWGEEDLNSSTFDAIFARGAEADLEFIASVFWSVRGPAVTDDQRNLIRAFWSKCVARSEESPTVPKALLSALSRLACFLETADEEDRRLLEAVASALALLECAPNKIEVLNDHFEPMGWSGSKSATWEANARLIDHFENHSDLDLAAFARLRRDEMRRLIDDLKRQELDSEKSENERFE